jgi:hypothetical protein
MATIGEKVTLKDGDQGTVAARLPDVGPGVFVMKTPDGGERMFHYSQIKR